MQIIENMTFADYKARPEINHSLLKTIFPPGTPLDFQRERVMPAERKSDSMSFGSACHLAVFEPDLFADATYCINSYDRRTKAGKEAYEAAIVEAGSKIILTQEEYLKCISITENCKNHPMLGVLLNSPEKRCESSGFFKYRELSFKFRTDFSIPDANLILDLKTTRAGHAFAFGKSVVDFYYYTQAAFYMLGMRQITGETWENFVWIAVETEAPYKIYLYDIDPVFIVKANELIEDAITAILKCTDTNIWPGPSEEIEMLTAPFWMRKTEC